MDVSDSDFSGDEGVSSLAGSPMKANNPQLSPFKLPYPVAQPANEYLLLKDKVLKLEQQLAIERKKTLAAKTELADCKSCLNDLKRQLSKYQNAESSSSDSSSPMDCSTLDLIPAMSTISVGKRSHVSSGCTPQPARKVLKSIHLFNEPNSDKRYNINTKIYIMKMLCNGISYRQIVSSLGGMDKFLPSEANLLINNTPTISTIHRYFYTLSMLVKLHTLERFQAAGDLMVSVEESPDPKGKPIMISDVRNLKNGENIVTGVKR